MGTIYGTDYICKLPISEGESIVVILLRKQSHLKNHFPCNCYIGDSFMPVGIPIYGKYGEYCNVTDIENADDVIEHLQRISFSGENENIETEEDLEGLLREVNSEEVYGKCRSVDFGPLGLIMIKRNLYDRLINYIKNRVHYSTKETLEKKFKDKFFTELEAVREEIEASKTEDKAVNDEVGKMFEEQNIFDKLKNVWSTHNNELEYNWEIVPYLRKLLYGTPSDVKYYAQLEEIMFFRFVLEALHSGFYCITNGVDETEMLIHRELAKYILEETSRVAEELRQESIYDDESDEGVLKCGSFFPHL